ncbi:MAG: hypothetical protein WA191_06935 [Telluria sp.]
MNNEANRRLAGLLGWTSIVDVGGALLGTPPDGSAQCRGQAKVPDWAGDWRECGPLGSEHQVDLLHSWSAVYGKWESNRHSRAAVTDDDEGGDNRDEAARLAIVQAVCDKMKAGQ